MPELARSHWTAALLTAVCLSVISGCQSEDGGFHSYQEPVAADAPSPATPQEAPSDSGIVPVSAETNKPLPEVIKPAPTAEATTAAASAPAPSIPPEPPSSVALASLDAPVEGSLFPPRQIELLIPEMTFKAEGPDGALRVSFDDIDLLKVLNADPVPLDIEKHMPAWLSGLSGKTVRIRGWMFPPDFETEIRGFIFVRDNQICCFGRQALIYDKIMIRMRSGEATHYIQGRPFDVVGKMLVKSRILDGELLWLYMIEDAVVIDK